MWQERADYGHFFYRIPNGESAADAYDRVSGFNESMWRQFGEDDFASVCVLGKSILSRFWDPNAVLLYSPLMCIPILIETLYSHTWSHVSRVSHEVVSLQRRVF